MKTLKYVLTLVAVTAVMAACKNETNPETKTVEHAQVEEVVKEKEFNPDANYIAAKFEIDGMMCAMGCAKVIEKNIAKMDGVKNITVDFESKTAKIDYDEELVNQELLIATVKQTGDAYEVTSWDGKNLKEIEEITE